MMSKKLKKFFKTEKGKQLLKSNLEKLLEDLKKEEGWFSEEEDEYWEKIRILNV